MLPINTSSPKPPSQPNLPDMGANISSIQVQSFHNPVQNRANGPKRTPSGLVKGKPLIFSAMEPEKVEYSPAPQPVHHAYPSPPMSPPPGPARSPPPVPPAPQMLPDREETFDAGFSQTVLQSLNWSEQTHQPFQSQGSQPFQAPRQPAVNGHVHAQPAMRPQPSVTPRVNNDAPLPLQPPQLPPSLQTQLPPLIPHSPPRVLSPPQPAFRAPASPPPPPSPSAAHRTLTKPRPTTPQRKRSNAALVEEPTRASTLMLDDDPFAKVEPIRMLKPTSRDGPPHSATASTSSFSVLEEERPVTPEAPSFEEPVDTTPPRRSTPPSPVTPEDYRVARSRRRGNELGKAPPSSIAGIEVRETRIPGPFPLVNFVLNPQLLAAFLEYLSFYDWCVLSAVTKAVRGRLVASKPLREVALERYLRTVGYARWDGEGDPLELSLLDLHDYMRGVTLPSHEHARIADEYVQSFNLPPDARNPTTLTLARNLTMSTRAYTRVVLRLRAQAEREASEAAANKTIAPPKKRWTTNGYASNRSSPSRGSSRPPSPGSVYSAPGHQATFQNTPGGLTFRSPLFRLKRAPLLRVFVPSPDGDWLSDKSVLEAEAELKRAGVINLLRAGDVVWDIAVGDEGNVGRLVWDGSYLIDLDYKYSAVGDLPQYLPTLAFPPSYFHRVIRTGPNSSNPVAHIDISPWGQEIAANLQLLQDRIRTETPQGNVHNVVRWVHRSSFVLRAPGKPAAPTSPAQSQARMSLSANGRPQPHPHQPQHVTRIPIPDAPGFFVDPGWYGTIVVETEGTNEALAELHDRCPGAFPPRAGGPPPPHMLSKEAREARKVWKILREKSRPSEIWIRAVSPKERLF
ncbi:hypothetical protein HMN09_00542200 [Mycena chlorophos]|uniref:Uncharacterized protein n=1 Tax=Mycena chlorophos TaxID=658473 RepID=A0A8H6WDH9_MYCCL|nr:hypothetical protein HMN09_00542200 [Mycena chlorophos]